VPQLDKFIFASQFFWFFLLFFGSYYLLVSSILPSLLKTLKFRRLRLHSLHSTNEDLAALLHPKPLVLQRFFGRLSLLASPLGGLLDQLQRAVQGNQSGFPLLAFQPTFPLLLRASAKGSSLSLLPSSKTLLFSLASLLSPSALLPLLRHHPHLLGHLLGQWEQNQFSFLPGPSPLERSLLRFPPSLNLPATLCPLVPFILFFQSHRRYLQLLSLIDSPILWMGREAAEPLLSAAMENLIRCS
jgi:hypothetical protein